MGNSTEHTWGFSESRISTDPRQARALLEEALPLFQAAGRRYQEGKVWEALGDLGDGADAWQVALERYESLKLDDDASRVRSKLQ